MKKALAATNQTFESSSSRTPEYLTWHKLFKREFTALLTNLGMTGIEIGHPNHFDMSGFFTNPSRNQIWYFRIEDVRWSKDKMLIRTAKGYKDFCGGHNQYIDLHGNASDFAGDLDAIINPTDRKWPTIVKELEVA